MIRVLHITPHMGGGVGRVLSGFASQTKKSNAYEHHYICLEQPEKRQFIDLFIDAGCHIIIAPTDDDLIAAVKTADIVQIEFWNHPILIHLLATVALPAMRTVFWCHSSGLHFPALSVALFEKAHRFVFTSACSYESKEMRALSIHNSEKLAMISSGGGLDLLPVADRSISHKPLKAGYVGSLNFSKLHPDYVSLLLAAASPDFKVHLIGDETNREILEKQCRELGQPELLDFCGYSKNVLEELNKLDLFIYLLNPTHYGTAEIALLEAMAMGVVPIVMDNSCESHIVEHGVTGFIVHNAEELADVVGWLSSHDKERIEMAQEAASAVRKKYTYQRMEDEFNALYDGLLSTEKRPIDFISVFGDRPADWFKSFVRDAECFSDDGHIQLPQGYIRHAMYEHSKGSVFHFQSYFKDDQLLNSWADALEAMQ